MTLNNFNSVSTGVSDTHTIVNSHLIFVKKKNSLLSECDLYLTYVCAVHVLSKWASFVLMPWEQVA